MQIAENSMIGGWMAHPLTRGIDIDDPRATHLRRAIIRQKRFLEKIYDEWYTDLACLIPPGTAPVLELGSGAGFLEEYIPGAITSEVFRCPHVSLVADGKNLPFSGASLGAIVMTDVFHHLPRAAAFLAEAARCVRPQGILAMQEPWVTSWSRLAWGYLHHEPFDPEVSEWDFPFSGPLSGANGALPWVIFHRDLRRFVERFPEWRLRMIRPSMPFRYLLSGGVSTRFTMPAWSFGAWRSLEGVLRPFLPHLAMFALIVLERNDD